MSNGEYVEAAEADDGHDGSASRAADLARLVAFRADFYAALTRRADALFELTESVLCTPGRVDTLVGLSLAGEHRRGHGALYDAVNTGHIDTAALQADTGLDIDLHVDAASGGFLAPFAVPDLLWDFRLPRVKSINASGHKMGLAPLGCGWALWRGYQRVHAANYATSAHLAAHIAAMGPFALVHAVKAAEGITAVTWRLAPDQEHTFSLFDYAEKLRARGWLVPAYTLPPDRQDLAVQRIIVRHGFSRDMADLLLEDMRRALDALRAAPPTRPAEEGAGTSFTHDAVPAVP